MASPETTFCGIFTAAGKGVHDLIADRFFAFNNVPQGAEVPRGHYEMDKDRDHAINAAVGLVGASVTVQWVASSYNGALALAEAARNRADGYVDATVQTCILESSSPVFGGPDEGSEQGLFCIEQKWKFNMAETKPTGN